MAFSDALVGAVKAPFKGAADFFGLAGKAAGPMGQVGKGAIATVKAPAGAGLRVAQGALYVAGPFVAVGAAVFGAKKLSEHLEKRQEPRDFAVPDQVLMENQALLDTNPIDVQSAQMINAQAAQIQQMLAAQPQIAAASASYEGVQEAREASQQV